MLFIFDDCKCEQPILRPLLCAVYTHQHIKVLTFVSLEFRLKLTYQSIWTRQTSRAGIAKMIPEKSRNWVLNICKKKFQNSKWKVGWGNARDRERNIVNISNTLKNNLYQVKSWPIKVHFTGKWKITNKRSQGDRYSLKHKVYLVISSLRIILDTPLYLVWNSTEMMLRYRIHFTVFPGSSQRKSMGK